MKKLNKLFSLITIASILVMSFSSIVIADETPINLISNTFETADTVVDNGAGTVTTTNLYDTTGTDKTVWTRKSRTKDATVSAASVGNLSATSVYRPGLIYGLLYNTWSANGLIMADITSKLTATNTYSISVDVADKATSTTAGKTQQLCLRLTKADGTFDVQTIGSTALESTFNTITGTYTHSADYVKVEVYVDFVKDAAPTTPIGNAYYLDNFKLVQTATGSGSGGEVIDPEPDPDPEPEPDPDPTGEPVTIIDSEYGNGTAGTTSTGSGILGTVVSTPNKATVGGTMNWYCLDLVGSPASAGGSLKIGWAYIQMSYWNSIGYVMATDLTPRLTDGNKYSISTDVKLTAADSTYVTFVLRQTSSTGVATDTKIATVATEGEQVTATTEFIFKKLADTAKTELLIEQTDSEGTYIKIASGSVNMYTFDMVETPVIVTATEKLTLALTSQASENMAVNVTNPNAGTVNGTLVIATYDNKNTMINLKFEPISLTANEVKPVTTTIPYMANYLLTVVDNLTDLTPIATPVKTN